MWGKNEHTLLSRNKQLYFKQRGSREFACDCCDTCVPEEVNVRCMEGRLCPISTINAARRARVQWKKFRKSALRPRKPPVTWWQCTSPFTANTLRSRGMQMLPPQSKEAKHFCPFFFVLRAISRNLDLETTYLELLPNLRAPKCRVYSVKVIEFHWI